MLRIPLSAALLALVVPASAQSVFVSPSAAAKEPDFGIQGEYVGPRQAMQVVAMGDGDFDVVIFAGGLPGAGWDRSPPRRASVDEDQVLAIADANQMQRVQRKSPTLGQQPPEGAVVLFDGTEATLAAHWQSGRLSEEGLLEAGTTSRQQFQDYSLHLEFRTPFAPNARGQGRGNSGVYHQGRYETQILDSFGLEGKDNECGGIYSVRAPGVNMCFPPLQWQTYDVDFTAARYDNAGEKQRDAELTVRLNGVVVQQGVALPHATTAAPLSESSSPGPIYLQDHGNPVRYRNIWVLPRDLAREARRPRVPGFERFYAQQSEQLETGGRILISELGCATCHTASSLPAAKQAPILDGVGSRIRPDHLLAFIRDPHGTKPGTTMPDLVGQMPLERQQHTATAIASFLLSTGTAVDRIGDPVAARRGGELYHRIGCTACHLPQNGTKVSQATSVPFPPLGEKYTLDALVAFLGDPHAVRPSGRMPKFGLQANEAMDVATFLLRDVILGAGALNMQASFYEGSWDRLPDFDELEPYATVETYGLDIAASGKRDSFGARFDTFLFAPQSANYKFHLGSDDGSRLLIDGKEIIQNDGVHPMQTRTQTVELKRGLHAIRIEYFEKGGEESLRLEVEGGGLSRVRIESIATLDQTGAEPEPLFKTEFQADPDLIDQGRQLFSDLGCAACHQVQLPGGERLVSQLAVPSRIAPAEAGCLSTEVPEGVPNYEFANQQRAALQAALQSVREPDEGESHIHLTMARMNCYACHRRGSWGGPELARDSLFTTTMKEMGDEGRIPPPLTGVGDKLKESYLKQILNQGANERPYMHVRMPGFGTQHLPKFIDTLIDVDQKSTATIQPASGPPAKVLSAGRLLAGNKGLSCVKCHLFNGKGAPGIGAIDMQRMSARLREDWFHRYLMQPSLYRPGTRMPSGFPDGQSVVGDVFDGNPSSQIDALWQFLSAGNKARPPIGVEQRLIELQASDRPVLYRNFLDGLSPRGIGVGYPEGANLAWDANAMSLALVWKGAFMDASKHWVGRGPGNQSPLGDELLNLERVSPLAVLDLSAAWPSQTARERGYKFLGFRLDAQGRPTFRYRVDGLLVEETPLFRSDEQNSVVLRREFKLAGSMSDLVFRAAHGKQIIEREQGWFDVDATYQVRLSPQPQRVQVADRQELRVPVDLKTGSAILVQEIRW